MKKGVIVSLVLVLTLLTSCNLEAPRDFDRRATFDQIEAIDYPFEWPDPDEKAELFQAYETESKAMALYRKVLDDYPTATLFSSAIITQDIHVANLEDIFLKYEYGIPEKNWYVQIANFSSSKEGCEAALDFATEAIIQYTEALDIIDNEDIKVVFEANRRDYENIYVPRFEDCR